MKKCIISLACIFLTTLLVNAATMSVKQNGKTTKYEPGQEVLIEGNTKSIIKYKNVKLVSPKNTKFSIKNDESGNMQLIGNDIANVVVTIDNSTFVVNVKMSDKNLKISKKVAVNGTAVIVTADSKEAKVFIGDPQTVDKQYSAVGANNVSIAYDSQTAATKVGEVPAFISSNSAVDLASQQATKNLFENATLSPSSPR